MPENRNNKGDLKPITVLCAMDVYLPQMDGVINCMRNYLLNYPEDVKGVAACPKPREELHEPYPIIYYRSFRVPFTKIDFGFPSLDKKFYDTVMNTDIDLIHVHAPFGVCKVLTKVAREKNIPIVSHVHTNYREVFRKITRNPLIYIPYVNTLGKRYSKTDVMFAGTEATERLLRRDYKYTGEVSIVPFGTNLLKPDDIDSLKKAANERFSLGEDEFVFCTVSRIVRSKRIQFSLEALAEAKKRGRRFRFIIGGTGNYVKNLELKIKQLGLENEAIMAGYVSNEVLARIYARADMFLFPSVQDTFGLVKVEAAAFGTAGLFIEGSDAAYGTENGVNSVHIDDDLGSFTDAVCECVDNPDFTRKIGENASRDLYFTWQDSAKLISAEYRRIIEDHRKKFGEKR